MLTLVFQVLPVAMAIGLVAALHRTSGARVAGIGAVLAALWIGATGALASSGFLTHFDPPRIPALLIVIVAWLVWAWRSGWGARLASLPLNVLVGFQAFRIFVELGIHEASSQGIAPVEMSWSGWNFDIVSGVSALLLLPIAHRIPRWTLKVWNAVAFGLLLVVVATGVLSLPTPFQVIDTNPPNTWITTLPYVWLPCVHVAIAWLGHLLLFKALRLQTVESRAS